MTRVDKILALCADGVRSPVQTAAAEMKRTGKRAVGCMLEFCPEEIVYAANMLPVGLWGADIELREVKRYFPAFFCAPIQQSMELALQGAFDGVLALAKKLGRDDILMKGYVEVLCYTVRAENFTLMEKYIGLAYRIKEFQGYEREHGIILRLQGYLMFMREKYEDAERYLKQSVEIFEQPKLLGTNFFNLAAAYDYLAINSRMQEKYDEALEYIHRAISICTEKEVQKSLDVFYADCGYILFLKKDYDRAEKYFLQSIELYERFETYWLRSVAESGLSMIYALQGNRKLALEHFRQAEVFSQKERAMEEIEMLQQARELLRQTNVL